MIPPQAVSEELVACNSPSCASLIVASFCYAFWTFSLYSDTETLLMKALCYVNLFCSCTAPCHPGESTGGKATPATSCSSQWVRSNVFYLYAVCKTVTSVIQIWRSNNNDKMLCRAFILPYCGVIAFLHPGMQEKDVTYTTSCSVIILE